MRHANRHEGMALVAAMVMVLLAALLLASALRTAWFNELTAGTQVDDQRAFENAQALLRDAEADIRGACGQEPSGHCRQAAGTATALPRTSAELASLRSELAGRRPSCSAGLCVPDGLAAEFWRAPAGELDRMKAVAARYGDYSGAPSLPPSHPLLTGKGWYWDRGPALRHRGVGAQRQGGTASGCGQPFHRGRRRPQAVHAGGPAIRRGLQEVAVMKHVNVAMLACMAGLAMGQPGLERCDETTDRSVPCRDRAPSPLFADPAVVPSSALQVGIGSGAPAGAGARPEAPAHAHSQGTPAMDAPVAPRIVRRISWRQLQ